MANKVQIGIEAKIDTTDVQAGVKKVIDAVADANNTPLNVVDPGAAKDLDAVADKIDKVGEAIDAVNKAPVSPVAPDAAKDVDDVAARLEKLDAAAKKAAKNKVSPVSPGAARDTDSMNRAFQQFMRLDEDFRRRAKATGQEGTSFDKFNFDAAYTNPASRERKRRQIADYIDNPASYTGGGGGAGGGKPGGHGFRDMAVGAAQSGMRAAGPVGGVAASALGTGMSAGAGAGLMGLMGGMLALGVGKLVGAAMEHIGQAENNSVALDTLKRSIGDVNVSFEALKSVVQAGAQNMRLTYDEAGRLSTQFAKLGNIKGEDYKSLAGELEVGVGMSRSMGLDPSQGMGVMGQMRGLGVTTNTQESRRFALLIGETIGKSDAFAKSGEVMDALAAYTSSQTRANLGDANTAHYAGAFSALAGSGTQGMDPANAAAMLGRVNASLSAGGSFGEASQFFTGMVGARMGLDPLHTQVLREKGAFATNDSAFGKDSAYAKYMGHTGPKGGLTLLQGTADLMREKYPGDDDNAKLMRAQAYANHTGLNMAQSMAMLTLKPNDMGEMQKYGDLEKFSGSGITNIAKALRGTTAERDDLARDFLGRSGKNAIAAPDRAALETAQTSGDDGKLRDVLATLSAKYGQEQTQGSDIRDSKNALENIKTDMADKVVPYLNEMRMGIMHLAGYDKKKTSEDIMRDVITRGSEGRAKSISGRFAGLTGPLQERQEYLQNKERSLDPVALRMTYRDKPEVLADKLKERTDVQRELSDVEKKLKDLSEEKAGLLKKENERRAAEIEQMEKAAADRAVGALGTSPDIQSSAGAGRGTGYNPTAPASGRQYTTRRTGDAPDRGNASVDTSELDPKLAAAEERAGLPPGTMKAVLQQEIGSDKTYLNDPAKYHYPLNAEGRRVAPHTGKVSTAFGPFGILESTAKDPGYGVKPLQDKSLDEQIRFSADYLAARAKSAGSLEGGLAGYGEGPASGYASGVMKKMGAGGRTYGTQPAPGKSPIESTPLPPPSPGVNVPQREKVSSTPLPTDVRASDERREGRIKIETAALEVIHRNERGEQMAPSQQLAVTWRPASPFGTERFA